jgi:phosphoribosyl 1,2-cyclic phosphodiesterase
MQAAIAHFPTFGVTRIDAVLLTHAHADACFGMDDLRALSAALPVGQALSVYLRQVDLDVMKGPFGYLMPTATHNRFVASLEWLVFDPSLPLNILGLEIIPLEVEHGAGYTSLGYAFDSVVYISDLNRIYDKTRDILQTRYKWGSLPSSASEAEVKTYQEDPRIPMQVFIVDALYPDEPYPSHYSLTQAIEEAKIWRPGWTLTVGMAHQLNHQKVNEKLQDHLTSDNLRVEMAFDGQILRI